MRWSRPELLLAMHLYCRIPFGRQHYRAPEIIDLAARIGRTPDAVAMKLNNLTSVDPEEKARGVRGLPGASALDRAVWKEFEADWDGRTAEAEALWRLVVEQGLGLERVAGKPVEELAVEALTEGGTEKTRERPELLWEGETEVVRPVRVRLGQAFFRRTVLAVYRQRCCITGLPVAGLVEAAHIAGWSGEAGLRTDPRNGLALSRLHHGAFDRHLISLDADYRLVLGPRLREHCAQGIMAAAFAAFEGKQIELPERFPPSKELLARHREKMEG